jgi:hypothetical protein
MSFFRSIFSAIGRFFSSIFSAEINVADNINAIVANYNRAKSEIDDGIARIKDFELDPRWKSRVINVPLAVEHVKGLYDDVFGDFRERVGQIIEPMHQLSLIFRGESETPGLTETPSALSRTAVKVDEIATMISQIKTATDTALTFVDAFDNVIINLESLEVLFLSQSNPRRTEHLVTGEPVKIRVGKLHGS